MHTLKHGNKEKLSIKIAFREKFKSNIFNTILIKSPTTAVL